MPRQEQIEQAITQLQALRAAFWTSINDQQALDTAIAVLRAVPQELPNETLKDLNARLQMKMALNADEAQAEQSRLTARISYLEGTALPHARKQEHANGFQAGWHAALARIRSGDSLDELAEVVPGQHAAVPQEPRQEQIEQVIERLERMRQEALANVGHRHYAIGIVEGFAQDAQALKEAIAVLRAVPQETEIARLKEREVELQRKIIALSENCGAEMCRAEKAEASLAAMTAQKNKHT